MTLGAMGLLSCGRGAAPRAASDGGVDSGGATSDSAAHRPGTVRGDSGEDQSAALEETMAFAMVKGPSATIRSAPERGARPIGILRWGAPFEVSRTIGEGDGRWLRYKNVGWVESRGLVLRRREPPKLAFVPVAPDLESILPYRYARVTAKEGAPVYSRPPKRGQDPKRVLFRRYEEGYFFTVDRWINIYDRRLHRTTDYRFIPREGTATAVAPPFAGIEVSEDRVLPFLWVTDPTAVLCPAPGLDGEEREERCSAAPRHERLPFLERQEAGGIWYRTRSNRWIPAVHVAYVTALDERPAGVRADERWIHVDLRNQTAALYIGDRMTFITLISSGAEGHETPIGDFRIESKHITATMDNEESADAYLIQDVPWILFFRGSYALHGAFWHDRFGLRTSHGCVNLSPSDARRFWQFAVAPELPEGWHAVYTPPGESGTLVHISR